jgi:hypothetical protein
LQVPRGDRPYGESSRLTTSSGRLDRAAAFQKMRRGNREAEEIRACGKSMNARRKRGSKTFRPEPGAIGPATSNAAFFEMRLHDPATGPALACRSHDALTPAGPYLPACRRSSLPLPLRGIESLSMPAGHRAPRQSKLTKGRLTDQRTAERFGFSLSNRIARRGSQAMGKRGQVGCESRRTSSRCL